MIWKLVGAGFFEPFPTAGILLFIRIAYGWLLIAGSRRVGVAFRGGCGSAGGVSTITGHVHST